MKNLLFASIFLFASIVYGQYGGDKSNVSGSGGGSPPAVTLNIATASTANANTYVTGSFSPSSGVELYVEVYASGTVDSGTSVTESASETTFALIGTSVAATSVNTLYAYISVGKTTSTTSRTVTFNCPNDAATGAVVAVYQITNMTALGLNGFVQEAVTNNAAASTTPAPAFSSAVLTADPAIAFDGNATNPGGVTAPTSWHTTDSAGYATPTTGFSGSYINSGFTSSTVTWGSTSTAHGDMAVELTSGAGPATPTKTFYPVDSIVTMNGTTTGTASSVDGLNSGTYGKLHSWNNSNAAMTFAASRVSLPASVPVNSCGTWPQGIALQSTAWNDMTTYSYPAMNLGGTAATGTFTGYIEFHTPDQAGAGGLMDRVLAGFESGDYCLIQQQTGSGAGAPCSGYGVEIEGKDPGTVHSAGCVTLTPGTGYWYTCLVDSAGKVCKLKIYDSTFSTQIGSELTLTISTTDTLATIQYGNGEGMSSSTTSYFQYGMVDLTNATYPNIPH